MLRNTAILILLVFKLGLLPSQTFWFHYNWSKEDPKYTEAFSRQSYLENVEFYKKNGYAGKYYKEFSLERALYLKEDLDGGNIYGNFEEGEIYVRRILKEMVKDSMLANRIKIVFYRDASLNASMSESGLLRLNVGMLARLNNEAELALMLGHEIGHYINFDGAKYYQKKRDVPNFEMEVKYRSGFFGPSLVFSHNYWYGRDQEESADFTSLSYIKNSPYSLKAAGNLYRMFSRDDVRAALKYGKQASSLRSHPDPGDRMKVVKSELLKHNDEGKKNFIVDSLKFLQLKELCYMETVNISLLENDLDDLLTLTFSRYLREPENEYNLAVLIEALRRYILINQNTQGENKSFILSSYQRPDNEEALVNYPFLKEKTPSILSYLNKGLVDVWKEDVDALKAKDLLDWTKIKFTTYGEAYEYFKGKAAQDKSKISEHYKYFGQVIDPANTEAYRRINDLFETNEYLAKKPNDVGAKKIVVVMPLTAFAFANVYSGDSTMTKTEEFNQKLFLNIKEKRTDEAFQTYQLYNFNFADRHLIEGFVAVSGKSLNMEANEFLTYRSKENWVERSPEVYSFFKHLNVSELYLCVPILRRRASPTNSRVNIELHYYKITFPGTGKYTIVGNQKKWDWNDLKKENTFIKEVSSTFDDFVKQNQK